MIDSIVSSSQQVFKPIEWICYIRKKANQRKRRDEFAGFDPFYIARSTSREWRFERKKDYKLNSSNCLMEMAREVQSLSHSIIEPKYTPEYNQTCQVMTLDQVLNIAENPDTYLEILRQKGGPAATALCYLFSQPHPIPEPYIQGAIKSGAVFKAVSELLNVSFEKVNKAQKAIWETIIDGLHIYGIHSECICLLRKTRILKSRCRCKENEKRGKRRVALLF